ncbi:MAG: hypothetical protein ACLVCH_06965 [Roseburia inulinivorans]
MRHAHVAEIMQVEICNENKPARTIDHLLRQFRFMEEVQIIIRDHRHVTSLLHAAYTVTTNRVCVRPTMSFDERGHTEK